MSASTLILLAQMMLPWKNLDLNDEALGYLFRIICLASRAINISHFEWGSLSEEEGGGI